MKKINLKKLEFKKTNVIELDADQLKTIVGGTSVEIDIDPRSIFTSSYCRTAVMIQV
jgi:hypothetical protein